MADPNLTSTFRPTVGVPADVVGHGVFTRSRWNDTWVPRPYLRCNWASGMLAPGISSAELAWNFGEGKQADQMNFAQWLADNGSRRYVKILFNTANTQVAWYGVINGLGTQHGGVRVNALADGFFEQGRQVLACAGLEKIFDDTLVTYGAFYDYRSGGIFYTQRGLTFNAERPDGTPGLNMKTVAGNPVFSGKVRDDDEPWTLDKCLRYLTTYHRPRDKNGTYMPVGLAGTHLLKSTVDRPVIPTHGRSLRELLNQLLPHQRFLTWGLAVNESNNAIYVTIVSLTGDNIVLPSGDFIAANERRWIFDTDGAHADVATVLSHAEAVDVIRMQGNRATSTMTLSKQEGTLDKGWTADQQTAYNAGASTTAAYAAATGRTRKQKLNAIARGRDSLAPVYQRLALVDNWDGFTKHSAGGTGGGSVYFDPLLVPPYKFNPRELYFEKTLPLRDNYDYSGTSFSGAPLAPTKISDGPGNMLPPLVVIEVPATGSDAAPDTIKKKYIQVEKIALAAVTEQVPSDPNRRWSASVWIPDQDASIVLKVSGGPGQHVLAGADFSKLPEDPIDNDKWDWRKVYATVCVQLDCFCEGQWPPQPSLPDDVDYIRELVLTAPDTFRLDWLVPDTVVGVDPDGQLKRAVAGRWINDDREKLTDRARIAYEWYGRERRAITLNCGRINGNIRLGDFVSQLGVAVARAVNTVITEVRIDCPLGKNEPRVSYTTDYVRTLDLYLSPSLGSGATHRGALNVFNRKARPDFKHDVR